MNTENAAKGARVVLLYLGLLFSGIYAGAILYTPYQVRGLSARISTLESQVVELKAQARQPAAAIAPASSPVILNFYASPDFIQGGELVPR